MAYDITDRIRLLNGGNIDYWNRVYPTVEAANLAIPNEVDTNGVNFRSGKVVQIGTQTNHVEYRWIGGFGDGDLKSTFEGLATKEATFTTDTLTSTPARPAENKTIIPSEFGSSSIVADFTDSSLYFDKTKKLVKLIIANVSSGELQVSRATISENPPVSGSSLTKITSLVLNIVNGVTEYDVNLTVNQGEYLVFRPIDIGTLRYKALQATTIYRFSDSSPQLVNQVIANSQLGIGYVEVVSSEEYQKKQELSTFVKTETQPEINSKAIEVKSQAINVDTLNATIVDNSSKNVNITPSSYAQNATANSLYWTADSMRFTETKRLSTLVVANAASGQLEICRVTINGNPPTNGNVLTKLSTQTINIVSGTTEYAIDLTVNQGEWLVFKASVAGVLRYRGGVAGYKMYSFNYTTLAFVQAIDSYDLGIGYKVMDVQPPEAVKKIQLINFIRENQNNVVPITDHYTTNYLYGKKIGTNGDSTVKGHSLASNLVWDSLLSARNGMILTNYGINGNRLTNTGGTGTPLVLRFADMSNDFDYILISILTNDAAAGVAIGNDSDTADTTVKGALNILCDGLLTKYPGKRIGFISPELRNQNYLPYISALESICAKYSIPVFNNAKNGGVCWTNAAQVAALTLNDTYHLNATGMLRKSYVYEAFLRSL